MVIKQMVHDLLMPVKIVGQPIVREADGLAMSSRNSYLNAAERALAPQIFQAMNRAREKTLLQNTSLIAIETAGMAELAAAGFRPEYFSIRRAQDLSAPQVGDTTLQLLVAAWLGPARLIDNLRIELPEPLKIA
jgi:pantoate--beta-alanine ligase